ncbi:hypothetical protein [Prosthecobacter sp.]|uniref:hypothetical protein n=1 Tax=Prosthecobacter sp. TaxID=1965333 RepID=UPI003783EE9E
MDFNPYAAPQSQTLLNPVKSEEETLRAEHISTESTIKSVGALFLLPAAVLLVIGWQMLLRYPHDSHSRMGLLTLAAGLVLGVVGYGMRSLRNWARIPAILVSACGLIAFPIGTLISVCMVLKLLGKQARQVMTDDYRRIVTLTPHVKLKTSATTWAVLALVVVVIAACLLYLQR